MLNIPLKDTRASTKTRLILVTRVLRHLPSRSELIRILANSLRSLFLVDSIHYKSHRSLTTICRLHCEAWQLRTTMGNRAASQTDRLITLKFNPTARFDQALLCLSLERLTTHMVKSMLITLIRNSPGTRMLTMAMALTHTVVSLTPYGFIRINQSTSNIISTGHSS